MTHTLGVILGFDISPRRIAMAAVDPDTERIISTTLEHVPAEDDLRARRLIIKRLMTSTRSKHDIIALFLEDAYPGKYKSTIVPHALSVGQCEAFLLDSEPDALVMRLAPSTWRSRLGVAQHGKVTITKWAEANQIGGVSQDEADAAGVAVAGARIWRSAIWT